MKTREIKEGYTYSNGKGRLRKVIQFGDFPMYSGQTDHECVLYEIQSEGTRGKMTLTSFAKWAKKEA